MKAYALSAPAADGFVDGICFFYLDNSGGRRCKTVLRQHDVNQQLLCWCIFKYFGKMISSNSNLEAETRLFDSSPLLWVRI